MGSDLKEREKLRRECKVLNLRLAKGRECVNWAKNKIPDDQFLDLKAKKRLGNLCKNKTGATKEIKWLRKLREKYFPSEKQAAKKRWTGRNQNLLKAKIPSKEKEGDKKENSRIQS